MKQCFKSFVILLLGLLCFFTKSEAQHLQAEASLDSTSIMIGDQTVLHLRVRLPSGDNISFPILPDTITENIQIVTRSKTDTLFDEDDFNTKTLHQEFTITSFEAGSYAIPAFTFQTQSDSVKTAVLHLDVLPVKVDTSKSIYDIKQPLVISYSWIDWLRDHWIWVVIVLVVILLILGIFYYRRKIPKREAKVEAPQPEIPPHQIALEKLNELKKKKLWQQEQVKQYHIELSDIVREYVEKRYKINAQEQTSEEIFACLKYLDITEGNRNELRQTLILADLVKFAKEKPLAADNEQSMENAISFVSNTKENIQLGQNKEGAEER